MLNPLPLLTLTTAPKLQDNVLDCAKTLSRILLKTSKWENLICGNGLVMGNRIIDTRSESRNFASDEGRPKPESGAAADYGFGKRTIDSMIHIAGSTLSTSSQNPRERSLVFQAKRN
jgi:hypothetical protein